MTPSPPSTGPSTTRKRTGARASGMACARDAGARPSPSPRRRAARRTAAWPQAVAAALTPSGRCPAAPAARRTRRVGYVLKRGVNSGKLAKGIGSASKCYEEYISTEMTRCGEWQPLHVPVCSCILLHCGSCAPPNPIFPSAQPLIPAAQWTSPRAKHSRQATGAPRWGRRGSRASPIG